MRVTTCGGKGRKAGRGVDVIGSRKSRGDRTPDRPSGTYSRTGKGFRARACLKPQRAARRRRTLQNREPPRPAYFFSLQSLNDLAIRWIVEDHPRRIVPEEGDHREPHIDSTVGPTGRGFIGPSCRGGDRGLAAGGSARAADLEEATTLYRTGQYDDAAEAGGRGDPSGRRDRELVRAQDPVGDDAREVFGGRSVARGGDAAVPREPELVPARPRRPPVQASSEGETAATDLIERLVVNAPQRYASPEGQVALGRFFLLRGADPKKVLDQFYDVVIEASSPTSSRPTSPRPSWPSTSRTTPSPPRRSGKAPKDAAEDPRFHYLLARAFADDDRAAVGQGAGRGAEDQPAPRRQPAAPGRRPDRLRAVRRRGEGRSTRCSRSTRASPGPGPTGRCWPTCASDARRGGRGAADRPSRPGPTNPEVDHLIGRKLSQKYRFAEGAGVPEAGARARPRLPARQGPALPGPAAAGRGGRRAGSSPTRSSPRTATTSSPTTWSTLRDRLAEFRTLEDDGFLVRMDPREADLYGARVLGLLKRAQDDAVRRSTASTLAEPGDRRDLPAEEGVRRPDVRPARRRRAPRASASAA